jgi:hypothetical protein
MQPAEKAQLVPRMLIAIHAPTATFAKPRTPFLSASIAVPTAARSSVASQGDSYQAGAVSFRGGPVPFALRQCKCIIGEVEFYAKHNRLNACLSVDGTSLLPLPASELVRMLSIGFRQCNASPSLVSARDQLTCIMVHSLVSSRDVPSDENVTCGGHLTDTDIASYTGVTQQTIWTSWVLGPKSQWLIPPSQVMSLSVQGWKEGLLLWRSCSGCLCPSLHRPMIMQV